MSRLSFLLFLILALVLTGLNQLNQGVLILALPLGAYLLVAMLYAPSQPTVHISRSTSRIMVNEGGENSVELTVHNQTTAVELLSLQDPTTNHVETVSGQTQLLAQLQPDETVHLHYTLHQLKNSLALPDITLFASETLGLFGHSLTIPTKTNVLVVPHFPKLQHVGLRPLRTIGFTGPILSRKSGTGADFFGVRQYQTGDPLRRINWKATARHNNLPFTTEFEQERITDIGLILDARPSANPAFNEQSLLTHSVQAIAGLADALLGEGHRVGLLMYGHGNWVFPGYGRGQRQRILQMLASRPIATRQAFNSLTQIPTKLFPINSQLILVTPLQNNDEITLLRLRASGYAVLVISPDPIAFEAKNLPQTDLFRKAARVAQLERQLLFQQLQQGGVNVINWDISQPLGDLIAASTRSLPPTRHLIQRDA